MSLRFKMGEAFPADSVLGKWMVLLSVLLNDLILANEHLVEALDRSGSSPSPEGVYFFRLTCSHFREAAKFLDCAHRQPQVKAFLEVLNSDARRDHDFVRSTFSPWQGSFVETTVKPIRDTFFHYPALGSIELKAALCELAMRETEVLLKGTRIHDVRAVFADEVGVRLALGHLGDDANIRVAIDRLTEVTTALLRFMDAALTEYFSRLPCGAVTPADKK